MLSISLISLLATSLYAQDNICRVLALSGGGNGGAYEAGVVYGLAHSLPPSERNWQVVSGVSAGAINSAAMSLFAPGDEVALSEWLTDIWLGLHNDDVWKLWPEGLIDGLVNQPGLLDDSPLLETMQRIFFDFQKVQKELVVGTVNSTNGKYWTYDEQVPFEDIPTTVKASASMPGAFPPTKYDYGIYIDGGSVWNTNLAYGVHKCRSHVSSDSQIVVDVAICNSLNELSSSALSNTIDHFLRYREIKKHYSTLDDVLEFQHTVPNAQYRYLFTPSEELPGGAKLLLFNRETLEPMVELGKADVERVMQMGEGEGFRKLKQWQGDVGGVKKEFGNFNRFVHAQ